MPQAKKGKKKTRHPAQTPVGYIVTGVIMWVIGYVLFVLATDSASMLQWAGTLVAFAWGGVRIVQGIRRYFVKRK